jgi:hypothetical protein
VSSRSQRSHEQPSGAGEAEPAAGSARESKHRGRTVIKALLLGGVVALAAKPEVRNRLLDALFGPEEQFEYDSVTEPAAPPIAAEQGEEPPAAPADFFTATATATAPSEAQAPESEQTGGERSQRPQDDAPAEPPAPMYERWARSDEDAPAATEDAPSPAYEDWSRTDDYTVAPPQDPPVHDYLAWSRTDDATTPAGETVPDPAVVEELARAGGVPDGASDADEPAIGEAQSPRNGWWSPRRHRSEPTSEPPR